jgi:ER membrane protein complex subunit 4
LNVRDGQKDAVKVPPPYGYQSYKEVAASALATSSGEGAAGSGRQTLSQSQKSAIAAKQKAHAMQIAMRPGQQILMNAFMMYMSGSQLNIFSINVTGSAILGPLASIVSVDQTFAHIPAKVDLQMAKLVFIALNLAWLGLGLYKMSTMRLLPTTSADWAFKVPFKEYLERTSVPNDDLIL